MNLDLEELAAIIEQLDQADFTELHYEKGDFRLHVRRGGQVSDPVEWAPAADSTDAAPSSATSAPAPSGPAAAPAPSGGGLDPGNLPEGHVLVKAPMLGTFYGAPKPGAAPFVQVGDTVGPTTTLCIIEVMKLMNSVPAGVSGEVATVFLADGELAEFDQPLFAVKVSA